MYRNMRKTSKALKCVCFGAARLRLVLVAGVLGVILLAGRVLRFLGLAFRFRLFGSVLFPCRWRFSIVASRFI
jgi:hypothetical protein